MGYSYPGLASATGTRVDSAAKHTLAVKVSAPHFCSWCENQKNPRNHIHQQKMKYCMHKNELVLNVSQALNDSGTIVNMAKAYPHIVTNLGDMSSTTQNLLCLLYHRSHTGYDFIQLRNMIHNIVKTNDLNALKELGIHVDNENTIKIMQEIRDLPYFTALGYALTTAYACDLSGDTVGTALIGGMQTVQNGAFEIKAGQLVQWYFDFEEDFFYKKTTEDKKNNQIHLVGSRKVTDNALSVDAIKSTDTFAKPLAQLNRENFTALQLGDDKAFPKSSRKTNIAFPKPWVFCEDGHEHYGDKIRVFAKCINGGRGGDAIDIMLMTQCM